ncbi:HD-GYP domain-containing protein [Mucisphaera sp.]|uniref:HD-GYP domain-containing protein n=1 Tax=Mucisphaera sp. TaxID=2913024 RepID=UPI003D0FF882
MHDLVWETLGERCAALKLPVWAVEDGALRRLWPEDQAGLPELIEQKAAEALERWQEDGSATTWEPFPGCVLFGLGPATGGGAVVAALDRRCAQLAMEEGTERLLSETPVDAERLSRLLAWVFEDQEAAAGDMEALDEFSGKLLQSYEETRLLYRVSRILNHSSDPAQGLEALTRQIQAIQPFKWVALTFLDSSPVPELSGKCVFSGEVACSDEALDVMLKEVAGGIRGDGWSRVLDPDQHALAAMAGSVVLVEPIHHDHVVVGLIAAGGRVGDEEDVSSVEMQFFDATAEFLGTYHENLARFAEQERMFLGTLRALTASIDAKDPYTRGHSQRVALLAQQTAQAVGLSEEEIERVRIAGLVHDVGKIGVPERVLLKAGRLTDEEFGEIKKHPEIGYRILKDVPSLEDVLGGVVSHHERWDGRGYPQGLKGEDIPYHGRIIALADTFDAMSSTRSYRAAMPREKVLAEIEKCAGSQFDPELAQAFLQIDLRDYDLMLESHRGLSGFEVPPGIAA